MEKVRSWCGQPSDRGRLRNRTEQNRTESPRLPNKGTFLCTNTPHDVQIVKIGPQLILLPNPQIWCLTMIFNRPDTPKMPIPQVIHVRSLDPHDAASQTEPRSVQPFCTAHGKESLYVTIEHIRGHPLTFRQLTSGSVQ